MAVLQRITDFVPNTLIESQEVDDEFNQLVNLLSGVSTSKDTLLKYNHASDPVLRVDQLGAGTIQTWLNNGTSRATLSALGKLLLPAGIGATPSTDQISNFGTYFMDPTTRTTGANTTETDFSSKTSSANVFAADGDFMIVVTGFNTAGNANTKRYRIYFGSTAIYDTGALALNARAALLVGFFYRRNSTTLSGYVSAIGVEGISLIATLATDVGGQNFATTNVIKSTGQNGTAAAGDIEQKGFILLKGSV